MSETLKEIAQRIADVISDGQVWTPHLLRIALVEAADKEKIYGNIASWSMHRDGGSLILEIKDFSNRKFSIRATPDKPPCKR